MNFSLKIEKGAYYENLHTIKFIKHLIVVNESNFENSYDKPGFSKEESKEIILDFIEKNKDLEKTEFFDNMLYHWASEIGHSELLKPHLSTPRGFIVWGLYINDFEEMMIKAINTAGIINVKEIFKKYFPKKMHMYNKFFKKVIQKIKKMKHEKTEIKD